MKALPDHRSGRRIAASVAIAVGIALASATRAEDQLEEIVVTARLRDENLQSVPASISVLTGEQLDAALVRTAQDIAELTPGFSFAPLFGGGASTPVIRGLTTTIGEANVGFFVDGVYQSSRLIMDSVISEGVDRVEIIKGPQSALYGRNTFGGAVNYITRRPTNEFEANGEFTAGNDGYYEFRGGLGGPIVEDKLFGRISYTYFDRDGYFENHLTGGDIGSQESNVVSGNLLWTPSEAIDVRLRLAYDGTKDGDSPQAFVPNNAQLYNPTGSPAFPPAYQVYRSELPTTANSLAMSPGHQDHDYISTALTFNWTVDGATLTSITGYNDLSIDNAIDDDYEAQALHYQWSKSDSWEFSEELRIASANDSPLTWIAGLFYYDYSNRVKSDSRYLGDPTVPGSPAWYAALASAAGLSSIMPAGLLVDSTDTADSFAVFGQLAYQFENSLRVTLEARWAQESKSIDETDTNVLTMVPATYRNEDTWSSFLPRFTIDYHVTDDVMLYGIVAEGSKSGGFNFATVGSPVLPSERTYDPETAWSYEVGAKTTWADGRVRFNIDGFWIDWSDQVVRAVGAQGALLNINAGKTTSRGIELELQATPITGLDLSLGAAYTDPTYDEYIFALLARIGEDPDLSGNTLQYVSEYTAYGSAAYTMPIGNAISWTNRLDVSYRTKQYAVQTNDSYVGPGTLVNLSTQFESDHYWARLWVRNLFDEDTALTGVYIPSYGSRYDTIAGIVSVGGTPPFPVGFELFGALVTPRDPRTYGLTVGVKF